MKRLGWIAAASVGFLVVATVVSGPRDVWDVLTLHTIESQYADGQPRLRYRVLRWAPDNIEAYGPRDLAVYTRIAEAWHPNGQRASLLVLHPRVHYQQWTEDGTLVANYIQDGEVVTGVVCTGSLVAGVPGPVESQILYSGGRRVDEVQPPTWFPEEQVRSSIPTLD